MMNTWRGFTAPPLRLMVALALLLACWSLAASGQEPAFSGSAFTTDNPLRPADAAPANTAPPPTSAFQSSPPQNQFPQRTIAPPPDEAVTPQIATRPEPAAGTPQQPIANPPTGETQPPPKTENVGADSITAAEIETRRKQAEEAADVPDEIRKKVAEHYRQAAEHITQAEQQATQLANMKAAAEGVSAQVAQMKVDLEALQNEQPQSPAGGNLSELEQQLAAIDLRLKELKAAQTKLEAEPAARASRRKDLRNLLASAPSRRDDLKKQLEATPPADEPPVLSLARRTESLARKMLIEKQIPLFQAELAKYDAEEAADVLRLQRDILARQIVLVQKEHELANAAVGQQREADAREAVRQAQEEVINAQPVLKSYAEDNRQLAEEAAALAEKISETETKLKTARVRLEEIQKQQTQTKTKVENVGLTGAIGMMLRKQRTELPDVRMRRQNVALRQGDIDAAQLALYEYDDQRSDLSTPEPIVAEIVASAGPTLDARQRDRLHEATDQVLARKREYLDTLIRNYSSYFDSLVELDTTERQLINLTEEYQNYIDERVLWIRSARPLYADARLDDTDMALLNVNEWKEVSAGLVVDVKNNLIAYVLAGGLFATLLGFNLRFRRDISKQGEIAERGNCQEFLPTFRTALMTFMLVVPWPALLFFLAWRLWPQAGREGLAHGLVDGLSAVALSYFLLRLTRELCRPGGLGESHFGWPTRATRQMRSGVRMLVVFGLPVIAIVATFKGMDPEHGRDVLERTGMILLAAMMVVFVGREFSPTSGVFKEFLADNPGGWIGRLKHCFYWSLIAAPTLLGGLSLFGYHYTARQLAGRLYFTAILVLAAVIGRALLLRLLLIARRKLAMLEARRRRAEMAGAAEAEAAGVLSTQQIATEPPQVDLKTHSDQIQRLVGTGLVAATLIGMWCIWSDVVPALGFLDRFALWTTTVAVTEPIAGEAAATGEAVVSTVEKIMTVTLADVGLAVLIGCVTYVAARNAPGLIEISILRRLPLENSVRYAITTLASYGIILVGVIVGCNTIGLRWSQIQWLATALTFGLAFGLQEMFANFVAGLIILFERPVRVGDVVTVDDTTGVVSRIRIRATTITNWDRKEYIVPNKEFITGKLLNWTLSDQVNRIVINVGVAYGSNTKLAHELLLKCANDHPLILDTPPSIAAFEGFGDNSLNFCLRTFLPSMENRLPVIHDLHMSIDAAFREAGIEISFPQRDLHLRSLPPQLMALMQQPDAQEDVEREEHRGAA